MGNDSLTFDRVGPRTTKAKIAAFAKRFGRSLPGEYVDFLLQQNGGVPNRTVFYIGSPTNEDILQRFFTLADTEVMNGLAQVNERTSHRVPDDMVAIARDEFGNLVLVSVEGCIYFWDHEEEHLNEDDPNRKKNVTFLATSLAEFLSSLRPYQKASAETMLPKEAVVVKKKPTKKKPAKKKPAKKKPAKKKPAKKKPAKKKPTKKKATKDN